VERHTRVQINRGKGPVEPVDPDEIELWQETLKYDSFDQAYSPNPLNCFFSDAEGVEMFAHLAGYLKSLGFKYTVD
jgi:hypothetical protein